MMKPPGEDLVSDAIKAAPVGAAAMLARGLLSTEKLSFFWVLRSSLAAGIVSVLAGIALKDHILSENIRLACVGLCGFAAPEFVNWGIKEAPALVERFTSLVGISSNAKPRKKQRKRG